MIVLMYVARIPKTPTQPAASDTTDASVIVKKTLFNIIALPLCGARGRHPGSLQSTASSVRSKVTDFSLCTKRTT